MAKDPFEQFAIPPEMRTFAEQSVAQARQAQLVTVERQPGLEPQRVPGPEAGRRDPGGQDRGPKGLSCLDRHRTFHAFLARARDAQ